jgi:hypothetical protein
MGLYELVLLKQGTRGDAVKKLQEKLGVSADGQFRAGQREGGSRISAKKWVGRGRGGGASDACPHEAFQGNHG